MIFHSSFENYYLFLPFIGFIIGLISSFSGGGGGFYFIPVLTLLFRVPADIAIATSLAASLPIGIVGSIGHYRNRNIDLKLGIAFAAAGIIGALSGAGLTSIMTTRQLKISFGIYSILMAVIMESGNRKEKSAEANGTVIPEKSVFGKIARGSFFGFLSGIITATFGTAGTAPVQTALFSLRTPIKLVVGTSLLVSTVNTFSAMGAHFLLGDIDLTLVYFLTAGTVIGAIMGPKLLAGIKIGRAEGPIRFWYALGMVVFGIIMIVSS